MSITSHTLIDIAKISYGTECAYTYDPLRQRLTSLKANSRGTAFMDCGYTYDRIDNILSIRNTARPQGDLGGTFSYSYGYDDLGRLVSANGVCRDTVNYTLQMTYDIMSNPLQKTQTVSSSDIAASHDLHFAYGHTDNKGSHEYNMTLSKHRAKAVLDYLVKKGIPSAAFRAKDSVPTNPWRQTTPKKDAL